MLYISVLVFLVKFCLHNSEILWVGKAVGMEFLNCLDLCSQSHIFLWKPKIACS